MQAAVIVASIVAAAAALANWWSRWRDHNGVELVSKPLATIAIAVLAVLVGHDVRTGALVAAIVGFACCLAGDVALLPAIDRFVVGLASFLAGHVAFVVMFVLLGLDRWWLGLVAVVGVAGVASLAGRHIVRGARASDPGLAVPVQAYLAVICSMAVIGWATGRAGAIVGSAAFVASDAMLGWRQFVRSRPWMPVAVMITYHGALTGLALSLA
ncbi:MAG: lysoplasmalogenase [Actinobacteria bacterium]|nr:lysoplasmalogenase [Actinomycetota bacterium]